MSIVVAKFGGSSLADAAQMRKVEKILTADRGRRFLVVSAPGKRSESDTKITDMLYTVYELASLKKPFFDVLGEIEKRYRDIAEELGIDWDCTADFREIRDRAERCPDRDYLASRGEYLCGKLMAAYLHRTFVDPAGCVVFSETGQLMEERTNELLRQRLCDGEAYVIPGFYGADISGRIRTFSRGGSDVTGSLVARAVYADLYENWTDVPGMLFTDPRIVENPKTIGIITYRELRELSYSGATVLHEDAVFPVRRAGIPINIRDTNIPSASGTMIVPSLPEGYEPGPITGIAGRKGFVNLYLEKAMMNAEIGFGATFLKILSDRGIPFEHCPTGIDSMAAVVSREAFAPKEREILDEIREKLNPDVIRVESGISVIAVVGAGIVGHRGVAARVFRGVAAADVNVLMIDSGAGEMNIILSVADDDYERAIRGIYSEFNSGE